MTSLRLLAVLVGVVGFVEVAPAGVIVQSNNVGYSGTWQQYANLANALAGTGATATGSSSGVFTVEAFRGITAGTQSGPDQVVISAVTPYAGYFQYASDTNPNTTTTGQFLNPQRTAFELNVSGPATTPSTLIGSDLLPIKQKFEANLSPSQGNFLAFNLNAVFGGIGAGGTYANGSETLFTGGAGYTSLTGSATGLFENTTNGNYYTFNFGLTGPAAGQPLLPEGAIPFASNLVIPEPATLVAVGVFSFGALALRRRKGSKMVTPAVAA